MDASAVRSSGDEQPHNNMMPFLIGPTESLHRTRPTSGVKLAFPRQEMQADSPSKRNRPRAQFEEVVEMSEEASINIEHAHTIVERIAHVLKRAPLPASAAARDRIQRMRWHFGEKQEVALLLAEARQLTRDISEGAYGHDRLGQCIRNLFECLGRSAEGAKLSLLAGEDPNSLQRPC